MTSQQISSILRQIGALVAIGMGVLTQVKAAGIPLPTDVSTILAAAGGILLVVEHYVSDPSTGTPVTTTTTTTATPVVTAPGKPPTIPPTA
jgi:hypothetical protein